MYIPKVGDVIKRKTNNDYFTIIFIVNNLIGYCSNNYGNIFVTSIFSDTFTESRFIYPKEKFVPKIGDTYYYPSFDYSDDIKVLSYKWRGYMSCNREDAMLAKGLIFATEQEALEARDKMISSLKN